MTATATALHADFARALLDAAAPWPPGLLAWNGSDVGRRFGVYRNNVVVSLQEVLGETFPVVRRLVGDDFFRALAREFVTAHPPRSPVMAAYGDDMADWLAGFAPAAALPYLPAMARLERARVVAQHAADATPLPVDTLQAALADPPAVARLRLALHPSLAVVQARHAVVSLWAAHQLADDAMVDAAIAEVTIDQPEAALVLRDADDDVLLLPLPPSDAAFVAAVQAGATLGAALDAVPDADPMTALTLLLRHGALVMPLADGSAT